jgi:hypothetical protein
VIEADMQGAHEPTVRFVWGCPSSDCGVTLVSPTAERGVDRCPTCGAVGLEALGAGRVTRNEAGEIAAIEPVSMFSREVAELAMAGLVSTAGRPRKKGKKGRGKSPTRRVVPVRRGRR